MLTNTGTAMPGPVDKDSVKSLNIKIIFRLLGVHLECALLSAFSCVISKAG
jgi:hypothetical protein